MNPETQRSGQAPAQGQERYSMIMTVISQIREMLTLGRGAIRGFDNPPAFRTFVRQIREHREAEPPGVNYEIHLQNMHLTPSEVDGFESIFSQICGLNARFQVVNNLLGPLETQAEGVMRSLSPGGGRGEY